VRFGPISLEDASGAILAHTVRLPGGALQKGTILSASSIQRLRAAGHGTVIAARLQAGDVAEDEAARRVADALLAPGLVASRPGTGRVNLSAAHAGLFRVDADRLDALNAVHEGITVATLRDAVPVQTGDLLATIKIIPFAVADAALTEAERLARTAAPLRLPAFRPLRVGLVLTVLSGVKPSVLRGTIAATEKRVGQLGGALLPPLQVPHETPAVAAALGGLLRQGAALLLVAAASATVDRQDVGPAAIAAAGGRVDHFGMPVDPGNLICIGHIDGVPALVLPGCARSPALNGIDLVLRRLFAGERVAAARLGVGGLLKEFAARPAPRLKASPPRRVAAVVLAAGLSSRMAPDNKLLISDRSGMPMIARSVDAVLASRAAPVLVVVGHQADAVAAALEGRKITLVSAAEYKLGLAASLRAGLAAVPAECDAALICLGDMPLVSASEINALLDAYDPAHGHRIVVPTHGGRRGNPVLWDRCYFSEMMALTGDAGARGLLTRREDDVRSVELSRDAVLRDFDTPATLGPSAARSELLATDD